MRDTRSLLLTIVSILLIIVSMALLWSWGYNYGNKKVGAKETAVVSDEKNNSKQGEATSLKKMYAEAKSNLNILDSALMMADSLNLEIGDKMKEFYSLRDQLANLLGDPASKANLINALVKINELQEKVEQLKRQNFSIEKENKRLAALLAQLSKIRTPEFEDPNQPHTDQTDLAQQATQDPAKSDPIANVTDEAYEVEKIGLNALTSNEADPNETTDEAAAARKIKGFFNLQNNNMPETNGEFIVVVTQPNGRVLKPSGWESGTFQTPTGRKIFSCKVRFECNKGENRTFSFKLEPEEFMRGTYQMDIFYNQDLVATATQTLH